jgi:hypothetical protein
MNGVVTIVGVNNPPVRLVWACDAVAALDLFESVHRTRLQQHFGFVQLSRCTSPFSVRVTMLFSSQRGQQFTVIVVSPP